MKPMNTNRGTFSALIA